MRGVQQAWKAAEKVLKDHRVRRTPINVARIASKHATVVRRALELELPSRAAAASLAGRHGLA